MDYWTPVREVIYFKRAVYVRALDELAQRAFPTIHRRCRNGRRRRRICATLRAAVKPQTDRRAYSEWLQHRQDHDRDQQQAGASLNTRYHVDE